MKTLYLSDLDGTLLNTKKQISQESIRLINLCVEKGMLFSVATARMAYACDYRLKDVQVNTPAILTNGVFLYDFSKKEYLSAETMTLSSAKKVVEAFREFHVRCFVYNFNGSEISIFYDDDKMTEQTQYYSEKAREACKISKVARVEDALKEAATVYITATGKEEELEPIAKKVAKIEGVEYAYYLNIYNGLYCIEVFSANATKKKALKKLKEIVGAEEVVVFGDNLNDLSMIEIADRSYAPSNALDVVKEKVTGVLLSCDEDGVALFLKDEFGVE